MTTRYGFEGGEPGGPPAAEKPRLAKTVFGRDVHLPSVPGHAAPSALINDPVSTPRAPESTRVAGSNSNPQLSAPLLPSPSRGPKASTSGSAHREQPSTHTGSKSSRPGVARFLGRRNTQGNIVPLTQTDVLLPSAPWIRPAVTVGMAAIGSFVIVAGLLWLLGPRAAPPPAAMPVPLTAVSSPKPAPTPPPVALPYPNVPAAAAPLPVEATRVTKAAPIKRTKVKAPHVPAAPSRKSKATDPDAPLPPTFF